MNSANETTPEQAAKDGTGLHYASAGWNRIGRDADWTGVWPEIDSDGRLTGSVVHAEDTHTYLNVDDEAIISEDAAKAGGWKIDSDEGRAYRPETRYDYTIERDGGACVTPSYSEVEMILAANPLWQAADDLPDGTEVDVIEFGGVRFKVYRAVAE